ncbi:XamI family restriction endonuclease [Corynebacterium variabile]|uniref:XamI family restriction endonuclease n=1 Tax=Corynebacterium variabile TaxID=1727 RepID=UPI003F9749C7
MRLATGATDWSDEELAADMRAAIDEFREVRVQEPLEEYQRQYGIYHAAVTGILVETDGLRTLRKNAAPLLCTAEGLMVIRYLASPPISEDDLKVLADATLTPSKVAKDEAMAHRIVDTVLAVIDSTRFPWLAENRAPSSEELHAATVSTAALIATQRVQTLRRSAAKDTQEGAVATALVNYGFTQVPTRSVNNTSDFPDPGTFCREALFGSRKADLIVRLWDGRIMPIECKVSNSSTNSVKRLNNDAAVKARTWIGEFGTSIAVPAAVLSGVFKVHNLASAQDDGLGIFWSHDLDALISYIEGTHRVTR